MLQQEAAEVIAMGGGFQTYYQQNRDGSLKTIYFDQMKELAAWCRARQAYCHQSKAIPQIALWYSTHAWKRHKRACIPAEKANGWRKHSICYSTDVRLSKY